jgi:proline iminopeptidase
LSWLADFADPVRAPALVRRLVRPGWGNDAVNRAMNADWRRLLADASFVARAGAIAVPVLVVHGAEDPRPPRLAERLAATLPDARLAVIPGAGHWPWLERPDLTRQALRAFLHAVAAG